MTKLKKSKRSYKYQYAAKFFCTSDIPGTSQTTDAFPPGNYQTAVNIHNPHDKKVRIRKKFAHPGEISKFKESILEPDGVERVTCSMVNDFLEHPPIHGFEGFFVVESNRSIDVVAVYSAAKEGGVESIDVEEIKERRI